MPQSLIKNYTHITFSTKNRYPFIKDPVKSELFKYLAGVCKELESYPIIVGGFDDHVHLLVNLSQKMALMTLVEKLKVRSSKWIKTKDTSYESFYWQRGYACFSVNPRQIEVVKEYIRDQENHHKTVNFKDEYRTFLSKYNIDYQERYVWD